MSDACRGKLKLYIGYAAGVGKTYKMLEDGQALKLQQVDVVIGYFEPHGRKETIDKTAGLEVIPRTRIEYRGSGFEEMDTDAVLTRRPQVCLVDEYAHTNVPGSARTKRWEDIEALRDSGINVLTTMNIQHLESLNDQIWHITGIRVRETVPDWVLQQADEVIIVDLSPRALMHRLERGVIYDREKVERALQNFFRESTLVALRELALRETAHEVEHRIIRDESRAASKSKDLDQDRHQKIVLLVTADPQTAMLIRRARRVSDYLEAECFAVAVRPSAGFSESDKQVIGRHLGFARNMRIQTRILEGDDVARVLVDFARQNQITQIFLVRAPKKLQIPIFHRGLLQDIVRLAHDMQVAIVSQREPDEQ
jgi:two-component system sensor histidine kinase KdpD